MQNEENSKNFKFYLNLENTQNQWLINEKFLKDDILFVEQIGDDYIIRQIPKRFISFEVFIYNN